MTFVEETLRRTIQELFGPLGGDLPLDQLLSLGWDEIVADEPQVAVATLAEEQGRRCGNSRVVELEMARVLELDPQSGALVFALRGTAATSADVDLVLVADAVAKESVWIPVDVDGIALHRVPVASLNAASVGGIDADAHWLRLRGTIDLHAGVPVTATLWSHAVAAGRLTLAHEILGVGSSMLDLAVSHVSERVQFGVRLGTFQAVQHRLADVFVQLEAARSITHTAWIDRNAPVCAAALVAAQSAFTAAMEHCQQVMGGMGCTWESNLHRYIRRGIALSLLLDTEADMRSLIIDAARSTARTEVFT
jgi:hypothetical protein